MELAACPQSRLPQLVTFAAFVANETTQSQKGVRDAQHGEGRSHVVGLVGLPGCRSKLENRRTLSKPGLLFLSAGDIEREFFGRSTAILPLIFAVTC